MTSALVSQISALFDLRSDTDYEKTDEFIRNNVDFRSANAWTLVFAIFVASVGLNVNSTAVIIGAMLISPLMGPIVGAGYGLGINDFVLVKRSFRNLLIALVISVLTSTAYFIISPFDEAQSELLARTAPNFYDVLIAFFGGAAGIVALSRKEKGNAIPGVAIATALMPPLCTVGYGIANLEWKYSLGALYLFIINSVFISVTSYLFVRYLRFKKVSYADRNEQIRKDRLIAVVATVVIVPSLVTAWLLLQESTFKLKAAQFVDRELKRNGILITERRFEFHWDRRIISVQLVGDSLSKRELQLIEEKKVLYGLADAKLEINQVSLIDEIDKRMARRHKSSSEQESIYRSQLMALEAKLASHEKERALALSGQRELQAMNLNLLSVTLDGSSALLTWKQTPSKKERAQVEAFMRVRCENEKLQVSHAVKL